MTLHTKYLLLYIMRMGVGELTVLIFAESMCEMYY